MSDTQTYNFPLNDVMRGEGRSGRVVPTLSTDAFVFDSCVFMYPGFMGNRSRKTDWATLVK